MTDIKCNRCGKCCHFKNKDGNIVKCPQLKITKSTTYCRIYKNRIGYRIDKTHICVPREIHPENFTDCPYNRRIECK